MLAHQLRSFVDEVIPLFNAMIVSSVLDLPKPLPAALHGMGLHRLVYKSRIKSGAFPVWLWLGVFRGTEQQSRMFPSPRSARGSSR
jgi:hypothetical protein